MNHPYSLPEHLQFLSDMQKAGIATRRHLSPEYVGPAAFVPDEAGIPVVTRATKVKLRSDSVARQGYVVHPLASDESLRRR